MAVGSDQTRLIVLRGNSGSGKSTIAQALRGAYGGRGVAWVSQDLIRRVILREKDLPGGVNIGLIDQVTRYSLDHGYHVILEGILYADRYEPMLAGLKRDHRGLSRFYYLDVSLEESLRRHGTRLQAAEFSPDDMRVWYRPRDVLASIHEHVIPETSAQQEITALILAETQLLPGRTAAEYSNASAQPLARPHPYLPICQGAAGQRPGLPAVRDEEAAVPVACPNAGATADSRGLSGLKGA